MSSRARLLAIFALGLGAAIGAGYAALQPLREADAAALELWGEIGSLRDGVAALEPGAAGDPSSGAASRAELLGRLDRAEREFTARREAIVRLAAVHLSLALAAATASFWFAIVLASRSGARRAGTGATGGDLAAALPPPPGADALSFVANADGRLRSVSEAIARALGRDRDAFVGEPASILFEPASRTALEELLIGIGPARPSGKIDIALGEGESLRLLRLRLHARFDEAGLVASIEGEGRELAPGETGGESAGPRRAKGARNSRRGRASPGAGARPPAPPRPDVSRLAGAGILVALHNPDERRLVSFLLAQVGARITAVSDGDALFSALEGVRAEPFDAVLIEPHLPGVEGLAAVRRLRERGFGIPVIALVPERDPHLAATCRDSGCSQVASTPVDRRALITALVAALPELDTAR